MKGAGKRTTAPRIEGTLGTMSMDTDMLQSQDSSVYTPLQKALKTAYLYVLSVFGSHIYLLLLLGYVQICIVQIFFTFRIPALFLTNLTLLLLSQLQIKPREYHYS